ncbi:MAG: hypothetical protein IKA09_08400, partial [Lachnospiraceae bacterium]|nr:hypothetical protein [Lachnospiraceae bacterium]
LLSSLNPLEIIQGANDSALSGGLENAEFSGGAAVFELLHLDNLFYLFKRDLMLIAVCVLAASLLKLMIMKRPKEVAEKKMDILHKLIIVFVGASMIGILNILYQFFAAIFG